MLTSVNERRIVQQLVQSASRVWDPGEMDDRVDEVR
jgi:hypothetical protein